MGKEAGIRRCSGRIPGSGKAAAQRKGRAQTQAPTRSCSLQDLPQAALCCVHTSNGLPGRTALASLFGCPPPELMLLSSYVFIPVSLTHRRARLPRAFRSILQEQISQGTQSELLKIPEGPAVIHEVFIYEDRQTKKSRWTLEGSLWLKNDPR